MMMTLTSQQATVIIILLVMFGITVIQWLEIRMLRQEQISHRLTKEVLDKVMASHDQMRRWIQNNRKGGG